MIQEKNNLQKKIDEAFRYSSEKKIIIEDYEKGNEINVVGIVENKKLKILSICYYGRLVFLYAPAFTSKGDT